MRENLVAEAAVLTPELVALRRELHRIPEIGLELAQTQARVLAALDGLPVEISLGTSLSSITAVLRGRKPGPVVLLRGDMDGLPVVEATGLDFASTNGAMHACGHDLHMAGLVGAAKLLSAHREELPGTAVFMFQPGEEHGRGASVMIDEGVLDVAGERPVAAYGVHVMPGKPGQVRLKAGPLMASVGEIFVTVQGAGGHAAHPSTTRDPVPVLAEIILAYQAMTARQFNVFDPVVVSVTMLSAGRATNVIPDTAELAGSVRALSAENVDKLEVLITQVAKGIAAAHGMSAKVRFERDLPVTYNDPDEADFVLQTAVDLFGPDQVEVMDAPLMGSEDFSFVLNEVPGAFLFFGVTPDGVDPASTPSNHSPLANHNDAMLGEHAALLAELAWRRLERTDPRGRATR